MPADTFNSDSSNGSEPSPRRRSGPLQPERPRLEALFGKPPPQSPEAEMALLGAMILDPKVIGDVIMVVRSPDAFYQEAHARIYEALVTLYDRHQSGDLVQLLDALRDKDVIQQVGGVSYLEKLASETPGPAGALHWARIVADKARIRSLIETASDIMHRAYNLGQGEEENATEIIDKAEQQIFEIARKHELFEPQAMADLLQLEMERLESLVGKGVSGIRTHYTDLDKMLSGLQPGELLILAARPSMGKTAFAMNLAEQVALGYAPNSFGQAGPKTPVGFFSLEMSKGAIAQRLMSARSGVSSQLMRSGETSVDDLQRLSHAIDELRDAPIYIDDMPSLTVMALRARARRMVQQYGVRAIFIDYLQLMTAPAFARESRQVEVSAISRGVKALARELNMPVVCLSQLNRGPESRSDNRPRMSDLRESGSIEQDADVVMLLHREEYYHVGDPNWASENEDKIGVAEVIIAKQRNGPTGAVELMWDPDTTRFKNLSRARGGGGYAEAPPSSGYGGSSSPSRPAPSQGYATPPPPAPPGGPLPDPDPIERVPFSPGKRSGPVSDFRDGGGPDDDFDSGDVGGIPI